MVRNRKIILTVLLVVVSSLFSLKVGDLVLGVIVQSDKHERITRSIILKEHLPMLEIIRKPNDSYIENTDNNLEQMDYIFRTDENGFILGKGERPNEDLNKVDLLFLGGSTTECVFVYEEERFPYLISKYLRRKDGTPVKTFNGGVSGNHALHSFLNLIAKGIPIKPQFVVLMHAVNDVVSLSKTGSYWIGPKGKAIVQTPKVTKDNPTSVAFYQFAKSFKDFLIPNIWVLIGKLPAVKKFMNENQEQVDEWEGFRDYKIEPSLMKSALEDEFYPTLLAFVKTARAFGIEPILLTQFNRIQLDEPLFIKAMNKAKMDPDLFYHLYHSANKIVGRVAKEENVVLVDLATMIEPRFLYDTVHLNNLGSKRVATIIADTLSSRFPKYFILRKIE